MIFVFLLLALTSIAITKESSEDSFMSPFLSPDRTRTKSFDLDDRKFTLRTIDEEKRPRGHTESTLSDPLFHLGLALKSGEKSSLATASRAEPLVTEPDDERVPLLAAKAIPSSKADTYGTDATLRDDMNRLFVENRVLARVMCGLMEESMTHRKLLGELRADHDASIMVGTLRHTLEEDKDYGPFFRNLHAQLMGQFVWKDFAARYGGFITKPDTAEIAIGLASGAIRLIPVPGFTVVGEVFAIASLGTHRYIQENKRKIRQLNLKTSDRSSDILTRLAIGLTHVYKNQIKLLDSSSIETFNAAIIEIAKTLLSTHIIPNDNIVSFLLAAIPYHSNSTSSVLLKDKDRVPLSYLLTHSGIITPDGDYYIPIITQSTQTIVGKVLDAKLKIFGAKDIKEFATPTVRKSATRFSFRLSLHPLVNLAEGIHVHPIDLTKYPYTHFEEGHGDTVEKESFKIIQLVSNFSPRPSTERKETALVERSAAAGAGRETSLAITSPIASSRTRIASEASTVILTPVLEELPPEDD